MLRKIYQELVAIRKELQAIRCTLEFREFAQEDSNGKYIAKSRGTAKPSPKIFPRIYFHSFSDNQP